MVLTKPAGTRMECQRTSVTAQEVWCCPVKIILGEKRLWNHNVESATSVSKFAVTLTGGEADSSPSLEERQQQKVGNTLSKGYGNLYNTCRVIIDVSQRGEACTTHLGKFSTYLTGLEMCRQQSMDIDVQCEGRRPNKRDRLPTIEEVCTQVQKEERTHGLHTAKEGLTIASGAKEKDQSTKEAYKKVERGDPQGEPYKKSGHKERCWTVEPSLKSAKFK